ncbi:GH25 family lysozyme [Actinocorallia longicatena]|uniref:Excalibur calcium-binding domain-containing protein n=1 Tax=Actinocorallia longicatena TaxID=111803 RepID=A0ABP6QHA4_9ACTN
MRVAAGLISVGLVLGTAVGAQAKAPVPPVAPPGSIPGPDISYWQGPNVNWPDIAAKGAKFTIIRATRGTSGKVNDAGLYTDPYFAQNVQGARNAGLIQGSYHFATPNRTTGAVQADFFMNNGGGWIPDGRTLPGAVDLENDPANKSLPAVAGVRKDCYNMKPEAMITWIRSFSSRYFQRTGRYPLIYTNASWWKNCTGTAAEPNGTSAFNLTNPLWAANWQRKPTQPIMPSGFTKYTIWQFWNGNDKPLFPGDQNMFPGSLKDLQAFAGRRDKPVADVVVRAKIGKLKANKKATLTVVTGNRGPDGTGPVKLTIKLPKGLTLSKIGNRKSCKRATGGAVCAFPWVKANQKGTFRFTLKVAKRAKGTLITKFSVKATGSLDPVSRYNAPWLRAKVGGKAAITQDKRYGSCKSVTKAKLGPYRKGWDPEYYWYKDGDKNGVVCPR